MEKHNELPVSLPLPLSPAPKHGLSTKAKLAVAATAGLVAFTLLPGCQFKDHHELACPAQPAPLAPSSRIEWSADAKRRSVELFQAAVRIPTQSYDDNGEPGEDPRWAPFTEFQEWLEGAFPTAWAAANVEFINTLGIVATFEGSEKDLKPLLLMSHYDVVPAPEDTYGRWTHRPFDAVLDDGWVYGRGAADDKNLLVAQWEAITHLLDAGFKPRRTIILTHGFDEEEVHARRGQGRIAPFLEERYGQNGLLMVVDEGTGYDDDFFGAPFAVPGMGEKGYLDIKIQVGTTGGHSSVPPHHTSIGIMSKIVAALEDNPFPVKLTADSPLLTTLMCAAKHSKTFPKKWTRLLKAGPKGWNKLAAQLAAESDFDRAQLGTTTAVDVINGGSKVNSLPELVTSLVNFRIDFDESIGSVQGHVEKLISKVAKKSGLEFHAWQNGTDSDRFVSVDVLGAPLEPAPRTPSHGGVWDLFAGTVRDERLGGTERIVAPYASTGNTDCKMYYNLTKNVYRFMGNPDGSAANVHTVDERATAEGHIAIVDWIHALVSNADRYDGEE